MKMSHLLRGTMGIAVSNNPLAHADGASPQAVKFQQIRNATINIEHTHLDHGTKPPGRACQIRTQQVEETIRRCRPEIFILHASDARVLGFDKAILMGKEILHRASRLAATPAIVTPPFLLD